MLDWFRRPAPIEWYFVGDSHVRMFKAAIAHSMLRASAQVVAVGGATASGLTNPNSTTNALALFKQALLPVRPRTVPVIQLGEVDCGFVIWWRAAKYGEPVAEQMNKAVTGYFELVDHLLEVGYATVVVTSATLPTIRDGVQLGDVVHRRREVTASLLERTRLTLEFNAALAGQAKARKLPFLDVSSTMLDRRTGVIDEKFLHSDPTDHHLRPRRAGRVWARALNRLQKRLPAAVWRG